VTPPPLRVDFHFDVMCPFAFHASRWLREVRRETGLEIGWRFFSLEEVNRQPGKKHPWEREWSYGWSMLRIAALLRRQDMNLCDAWYLKAGTALHVEGRKAHSPSVARELLAEMGLDPSVVEQAMSDPTTHDAVREDHVRLVGRGAFGVPTLVFPDGQALFGPVLVNPPMGGRAVALWKALTAILEFPEVYEINRPKGLADQREIASALEVYLGTRDWISIDRGQELTFDAPAESPEPASVVS
jgi:predicted DsbA family dithiol-disulfide isomerase